jgi:thiol:disulfide interchange protein DsbD
MDDLAGDSCLVTDAGWATLLIAYAGYQLFFHRSGVPGKLVAAVFGMLGLLQLVGVVTGGRDIYAPVAHLFGTQTHGAVFVRVRNVAELDAALAQSKGKTAMLDFYADWCVSCKEMEKLTFTDARVKAKWMQCCCCKSMLQRTMRTIKKC